MPPLPLGWYFILISVQNICYLENVLNISKEMRAKFVVDYVAFNWTRRQFRGMVGAIKL